MVIKSHSINWQCIDDVEIYLKLITILIEKNFMWKQSFEYIVKR